MTKKEFLLGKLKEQAAVIANIAEICSEAELADALMAFMAITHLCGQEDLIEARTPNQVTNFIQNYQDALMGGLDQINNPETPATD